MTLEKNLFPHFQPIICAASGVIVGYEVLARQYDGNQKVISAGSLFSSSEFDDARLITWDRQVRRQALEKLTTFNYKGYLAINICASWLNYVDDFTALPTLKMLEELNIDKDRVIIEITESKADLEKLVAVVKQYRKQGLKVALDDFGAGYSQLERVMTIRPDIIKLDMHLFKLAARGTIERDIVDVITGFSKRTACRLVCEGIESEEEFFFALSCGAQYMQGYLFSPAAAEFKEPKQYLNQIEQLRRKFVHRTVQRESSKIVGVKKIKELIDFLRTALDNDFDLNELANLPFEESGILRFYLCGNDGQQLSSNFNFADGKWFEHHWEVGFNWAWRPYFYQLLALEQANDCNRLVSSERYRDFTTGLLCKTLSLRLDSERILLIDIVAE